MKSTEIKEIKSLLTTPKKIVIVPHKNPDGDAIGSTLALCDFLKSKKHDAVVIAPNDYPEFLKWVPGQENVLIFDKNQNEAKSKIQEAEIIFTLDFNHFSRTGLMEEVLSKTTTTYIMIDHHQQPDDYANYTYSDVSCSSTCEMVYNFIDMLDETTLISPEAASALYLGIMTDTGSFRFSSTTSKTHRVIANLIDKGAKNAIIHQDTFDNNSYERMQLLGVALNNMKICAAYKTAYITLSQEELDQYHFKKGDTEGFVNYSLGIKGIIFAAIFIENKADQIIKISLRSKGNFDVNQFAREHFHGGGHINAAGGRSDLNLVETTQKFEKLLPDYEKELKDEA
ncbi:DHH family phosphoesterase [Mesonia aestuariivivens]|uniref:Bifunctional oligoribonuclease/PAP phosphatase NrnA n=1 Tax=Mesonia aestuariivivens TaxID=2796128 RepID=A0ABS6VZY1_9FLAO|nr:bifunctional oligoribonuclease/PAP phosphatase NrnA [Mesonia aestuariivivens]MBW2961160.1 bifunctional oligoribonuclease/PAP phosphatase NrnA [Mesonia aestuariivivens]